MSENLLVNSKRRDRRFTNWAPDSKMDAVILAGTHRNPKRMINNENKAFLELRGKPLICHVVESCLQSDKLERIIVIGPRNRLEKALKVIAQPERSRLTIIQQRSRLLENVWNGFLATFNDGNNLPVNKRIETLLLGGHIPIRKKAHLHIIKAVYAAVAGQMSRIDKTHLHRGAVMAIMERRFDEFRARYERQEWFMGKMGVETILAEGHILQETTDGVCFRQGYFYDYFRDWEERFLKYIFITACDVPLMTADCVEDFIQRCNGVPGDFFIGVSSVDILRQFYSDKHNKPAIVRPYLSFREAELRAANVLIVKPNRIGNKELIQESFGVRKMTEWRNVISAVSILLRLSSRMLTIRMAILLQSVAVLKRHGLVSLGNKMRRFIRAREFEELLSRIFKTNLRLIETPYGGVSLDVDDQRDYELLTENFDHWMRLQNSLVEQAEKLPMEELYRIGSFKELEIDQPVE